MNSEFDIANYDPSLPPDTPAAFPIIPEIVQDCAGLTSTDRIIYGQIISLSQNGRRCFAMNKRFGRATGVKPYTAARSVALLIFAGLVHSYQRPHQYEPGRMERILLPLYPWVRNPHWTFTKQQRNFFKFVPKCEWEDEDEPLTGTYS